MMPISSINDPMYVSSAVPTTIVLSVIVRDPVMCPTSSLLSAMTPLFPVEEGVSAMSLLYRDSDGSMSNFHFREWWPDNWLVNEPSIG